MSGITVSTEVITEKLLEEVAALYSEEPYKKSLWHWQFSHRFGRDAFAVVARDGSRVVGFNGTMPIKIVDNSGQIIDAIWSCDFIVAPEYRGKGIGQSIKDEMAKTFVMPVMTLGISHNAFPLLIKKGWFSPARLNVWDLLLRPRSFRQVVLFGWAKICRAYLSVLNFRVKNKYIVEELDFIPQKIVIEHLWGLHRKQKNNVEILRDYDYLKWRYSDCPFDKYHFLHIGSSADGSQALIIFRVSVGNNIEVVDFIGFAGEKVVSAATKYWLKNYPDVLAVHWNTSISALYSGLIRNGFVKKNYGSRFATLSQYGESEWGLVAGDSDGDFLRVAREQFNAVILPCGNAQERKSAFTSIDQINIFVFYDAAGFNYQRISEDYFYNMEPAWNDLINKSDANPLFMSWQWMVSWWRQWGGCLSLKLHILLVFEKDLLVGIIPFYQYQQGVLTCYQFLGNAWGVSPTIRSEYMSPIFVREKKDSLFGSLQTYIKKQPFNSTFIFSDSVENAMPGLRCFEHRVDVGYKTNVTGIFDDYIASLGRMTRLKAFNRRVYLLDSYPSVEFYTLTITSSTLDEFFNNLNTFHLLRWGKPCFDQDAVCFHKQLLLGPLGASALLSYLLVAGEVVSASYNIRKECVIYNIQSGYLESFDKKISLGTLHMGWLIEKAFKNQYVSSVDFLAGFGRTEDYKKHYRGEATYFYTLQYFSSKFVGTTFSWMFFLKVMTKNTVKKVAQFLRMVP